MKLYLLSKPGKIGYDEFSSCVVCAKNEEEARKIHPNSSVFSKWNEENPESDTWVNYFKRDTLEVTYLGKADKSIEPGVILSDFNAG